MTQKLDLGDDNHYLEFIQYEGERIGAIVGHKDEDGEPCVGGFIAYTDGAWDRRFDGKIPSWDVVQEEPLTLTPSILCNECGDHGWVKEGRWIPA